MFRGMIKPREGLAIHLFLRKMAVIQTISRDIMNFKICYGNQNTFQVTHFIVGNKAKGRISKRVFQEKSSEKRTSFGLLPTLWPDSIHLDAGDAKKNS